MNTRTFILAGALTPLLVASVVFAQVVATGPFTVTTNPVSGPFAPGTIAAGLGSIQFVPTAEGSVGITSIPISFVTGGGATVGNLSNCQVFDQNGTALNTGANILGTVSSGSNTLMFNTPLLVSGTTTVSLRCTVSNGTPPAGTFQFGVGTPTLTTALAVNLDVAPSVPAGSQDVALANLSLDASRSGGSVRITSIPIGIVPGVNSSITNLTDCRLRSTMNLDGSLNTGTNSIVNLNAGSNTFTLDNPLVVAVGTAPMFSLTCDVDAGTPIGSTFTISTNPGGVVATDLATGASIMPSAQTGTGANGLPPATSGTLVTTALGSNTGTGDAGGTGGTPGVPNTGLGGDMGESILFLALSGLLAFLSALYVVRRA